MDAPGDPADIEGDIDTGAPDSGAMDEGAIELGAIEVGAIEVGAIEAGAVEVDIVGVVTPADGAREAAGELPVPPEQAATTNKPARDIAPIRVKRI